MTTTIKIPKTPKPKTLQAIKQHMKNKPYKTETYTHQYGWNNLIPTTKHPKT